MCYNWLLMSNIWSDMANTQDAYVIMQFDCHFISHLWHPIAIVEASHLQNSLMVDTTNFCVGQSLLTLHLTIHHIFELRVVFALLLLPNGPRQDCRVSDLVYDNDREKSRSQSSTFWHIQEKHGFHFLIWKLWISIDRLVPRTKLIE